MKKFFFTAVICIITATTFAQNNIGIGTTTPAASAALDISSTTKGLLIPRVTSVQRTAIISPATGLLVFDIDTKTLWAYDGAAWKNLYTSGGGLSLPFSQTINTSISALQVSNQGPGAALEGASPNEYGIGIAAKTTGDYGWGLYTFSNSPGANSIYAIADSGAVFHGENNYTGNTNTLMSLLNRGIAKTTTLQLVNSSSTSANMQIAGNNLGEQLLIYQTNTSNSKPAVSINNSGTGEAIKASSTTGTGVLAISTSGTALEVNGKIKIAGGNTNPTNGAVLNSDASGFATWKPSRIGFGAHTVPPQAAVVQNGLTITKIEFAVEDFDLDADFNSFTGAVNNNSRASLHLYRAITTLVPNVICQLTVRNLFRGKFICLLKIKVPEQVQFQILLATYQITLPGEKCRLLHPACVISTREKWFLFMLTSLILAHYRQLYPPHQRLPASSDILYLLTNYY